MGGRRKGRPRESDASKKKVNESKENAMEIHREIMNSYFAKPVKKFEIHSFELFHDGITGN